MHEAIQAWLKGPRNYDEGAKLYLAYGRDAALRRVFSEPVSDFKRAKLEQSLTALLNRKKQVAEKVTASKVKVFNTVQKAHREWPENLDTVLQAMHKKWKPLFAELMLLTNTIYAVALAGEQDKQKEVEAGRMAHRICELDDLCDDIYEERNYYIQNGQLKHTPEEELVVDPLKIPLAYSNAQRYVRDYKNKLRKNPDNVNFAAKLDFYTKLADQYKKILNLE